METWEYKTIQFEATGIMGGILDVRSFQDELNNLGTQGWELVSCFDTNMNQGQTRYVLAVFKRRK
jgi:hypothetical protein